MFCPNCGKENDDAVRHCQSCGSFIPDLSVLGDKTAGPAAEAQPMTYQALSKENVDEIQSDQSRYQEYTMADVAAKKSHKKLIIALIVTASVLVLGVAAFFMIRWMIGSTNIGKVQEDPTKYVLSAYQTTAQKAANSSDIMHSLMAPQTNQKTTRMTMTSGGMKQTQTYAIDGQNKRFYYCTSVENDNAVSGANNLTDFSVPKNALVECYATLDRMVVKTTSDDKTADYYVDLNNLRQDAEASLFGPKGKNVFGITQENYDTAMDVYEFVYNNLQREGDPFGLSALGEKLCKDFDECGQVQAAEEKADIDGTAVDAFVVTHTYNNTDIVTSLYNDVRDWIKNTININQDVNKMIDDALSRYDVNQMVSQLNNSGQTEGVELSFKHYINKKDDALMQTEIILKKDNQGIKLTLCFGADPLSSKKTSLKLATTDVEGHEMVVQTVTLSDESNTAEEKLTVAYVGFVVNGTTSFVRNKATGDFTLTNDMTMALTSALGMTNMTEVLPPAETSESSSANFSFSGNLKTTDDSMTLTIKQPIAGSQSEVLMEYYVSAQAEINELTSDNNLLSITETELQNLMGGAITF